MLCDFAPSRPKIFNTDFSNIILLNLEVVSMAGRLFGLTLTRFMAWFMTVFTIVVPVSGIQVSCSTGGNGAFVSSTESFDLDACSSLQERITLNSGSIYQDRQARGAGKNSLTQSISGDGFSLQNDIASEGAFGVSTSSAATAEAACLSQDVSGAGSLSLALSGTQGSRGAGQDAGIDSGALSSVQYLFVGQDAAIASQITAMAGEEGFVGTGAFSDSNSMLAAGSFQGAGTLQAQFSSTATERAVADGDASLDGVTWLDENTFQAVSWTGIGMGMAGQRVLGDGVGTFDMSVLNLEQGGQGEPAVKDSVQADQTAAQTAGGSYSSYALTGYRLNSATPVQLYLNPANAPIGMTDDSTRDAIAAGANTWDDNVATNIFADGSTVIVDSSKVVDDPYPIYPSTPKRDGYNVNAWWDLGSNYLGLCRWWTNGVKVGGYYSIIESDVWYSRDNSWTADLSTAESQGKIDLQSIAVHELGHGIGMGDIYSSTYGGTLDPSDPRTKDFNQVMNLYNGPQRLLGDGDLMGAQELYGQTGTGPLYWRSAPFTTV